MGNQNSITIAVYCNPPSRCKHSDSTLILKGTVYLSVDQSKGLSNVKSISIHFLGQEETVVPSNTYSGYASNQMVSQAVPFTSLEIPIYKSSEDGTSRSEQRGFIPAGQYEYPFEWNLPSNLPSSMNCHPAASPSSSSNSLWKHIKTKPLNPNSRCRIQYTLKAIVNFDDQTKTIANRLTSLVGMPQRRPKAPIRSQPHIISLVGGTPSLPSSNSSASSASSHHYNPIHSAAASQSVLHHQIGTPISTPTIMERMQQLYCREQGSISLSTRLDSGAMTIPSQQSTLSGTHPTYGLIVTTKNDSSSLITGVQLKLREEVKWCAHQTVLSNQTEGTDQVWDSITQTIYKCPLNLIQDSSNGTAPGKKSGEGGVTQVWKGVVSVPPVPTRDSYYGTIIQVRHFVQVKVLTPWHTTSRLKSKMDVTLTRKEVDWNSQGNVDGHTNAVPMPTPSAPPMSPQHDDSKPMSNPYSYAANTTASVAQDASYGAEAQKLPPDWNPVTADVITIPMEDVTVVPNR